MPKVLVLFDGAEAHAAILADAAAEGASRVRFTEVDVRVVGEQRPADGTRRKSIGTVDAVAEYHGVIVAAANRSIGPAIDTLLDALKRSTAGAFVDTVFASIGPAPAALHERLAQLGGILVSEPRGTADLDERARQIGCRVAKVTEWVQHALSHEHAHAHAHGHAHDHHHDAHDVGRRNDSERDQPHAH